MYNYILFGTSYSDPYQHCQSLLTVPLRESLLGAMTSLKHGHGGTGLSDACLVAGGPNNLQTVAESLYI